MEAWPGQYCINVSDIEKSIKFFEALGLTNTSRTEIPQAHEAVMMDGGGKGGKIQLAQQVDSDAPIDLANAFWKHYVLTNDMDRLWKAAMDFGAVATMEPKLQERWPVTVGFVEDPDGYQIELVQVHGDAAAG